MCQHISNKELNSIIVIIIIIIIIIILFPRAFSPWHFSSWTGGDPHRSGVKFQNPVLSVLRVMFQVLLFFVVNPLFPWYGFHIFL